MYNAEKDVVESYAFHFLEDVENPFIQIVAIGKERRYSSRYHWETRNRGPAYLFQYTLGGTGTVRINGQEHLMSAGKAFFLKMPGEESYYFDEGKNEAPWEFIYVMFDCCGAENYCQYIESHLGRVMSLPLYHEAIQLLFKMHSMAKEQNAQNPFELSSRAFSFLCLLCSMSRRDSISGNSLGARAANYIRLNCGRAVGISDAAAFLKVSPSHLSREFYKDMGIRPVDYLTKVRLNKAVDLLTSSEKKAEEIGRECGFSDSNYFSKVFKKHMGMTPVQFRRYIKSEGYSKMQI